MVLRWHFHSASSRTVFTMMTSWNGNIFRVTVPLCAEFTSHGEFSSQRPVTRSFDVIFDLRLNKLLSKQSWGWWFETRSGSLLRHCNEYSWSWTLSTPPKTMPVESLLLFLMYLNTFQKFWLNGLVKCPLVLTPIPAQHAELFTSLTVHNIHKLISKRGQ